MARKKEEAPQLNDKEKIIDLAMKQIQKEYGEGSIMKLGENQKMNIKSISTGSLNLDIALGVGGVPRGRIIEIYGTEPLITGGKSATSWEKRQNFLCIQI